MQRFSKFIDTRRADFWRTFYAHPELLSLFAYLNQLMAAKLGGYDLLSTYDIIGIDEHNPGVTTTWEEVALTTINDTGIDGTYRYSYSIDDKWLSIDGIADRHVDPTVLIQSGVDFRYSKGIVKSAVDLSVYPVLYVTKGQVVSTRLADYVGKAFGYERDDSYKYRDNMVTMLRLFYEGPTLNNLIAAIHAVINSPVAKYSDELVLSTSNGEVLTNKYKYDLGGAEVDVQIGDIVDKGNPLAGAVEIYTNKTHPGWWRDRIPSLFGKYRPSATLTYEEVDVLMETFLKLFVANVRINLRKVDNASFMWADDIWELILDGSTLRTDYIVSAYRLEEDDFIPYVLEAPPKLSIHGFCVWGMDNINSEAWIYAPDVVKPYVFPNDVVNPYWKIGSHRWHILDAGNEVKEFWSATDNIMPYMEPTHDYWHIVTHTAEEGTSLPTGAIRRESFIQDQVFSAMLWDGWFMLGIDPNNTESDPGRLIENVTESINAIDSGDDNQLHNQLIGTLVGNDNAAGSMVNTVYGEMNVAHAELTLWTLEGTLRLAAAGIVIHKGDTYTAYSPPIYIGCALKNATVTISEDVPVNTSTLYYYSLDGITWSALQSGVKINNVYGNLYIKATLQASPVAYPTFEGLDISLELVK